MKHSGLLPAHFYDLSYLIDIERRSLYQPVSRDVALALNIPLKKCRKLMRKYAPGYIVDYENLHYWAGEVPDHIVDIFGDKIITISRCVSRGLSLHEVSKMLNNLQ